VLSSDDARSNSCSSYWSYIGLDSTFVTDTAAYEWPYGKAAELSLSGATVREDVLEEGSPCISPASAVSPHCTPDVHVAYSALIPG
jgi:hypothetical protein